MFNMDWVQKASSVKAVLLDISGVLYDSSSTGGVAIPGSVDAVKRLKQAGVPVRFCTNETQFAKEKMAERLQKFGFELTATEIFPPAPAVCRVLRGRGLTPHLLVHPGVMSEFEEFDMSATSDCVVMGDAGEAFTYENVNKAFQVLIGLKNPVLFSLGLGKYYLEEGELKLDVGAYTKALEYACDLTAEVVGKPSKAFFHAAVKDMGMLPEQVLMVGDDVISDVGGAQKAGLALGLLVRTGKYRPSDEQHPQVTPDGVVDNLSQAVDNFLTVYRK